ncbi:MAG: hypothetical protein ACI93R_001870 [Flavobacteriales bacterium]|jgi:hypothetical protein
MCKIKLSSVLALILCFYTCTHLQAQENIRFYSRGDANAVYSIGILKLGLSKIDKKYTFIEENRAVTGARQNEQLKEGEIDVIWTATSNDNEAMAIPIRIPLYKGLMGHRVLLTHKDNRSMFRGITRFDDLKKFRFGQGRGWPDTMIMQHNGLTVVEATKYESLFYMTDGSRFDAFPRGIHEPWGEMAKRPKLELTVDTNVMLVYKMPFYLFVNPERKQLALDIYTGIMIAIEDGSFDDYFYQNDMVKMVLQKVDLDDFKTFELTNPNLPSATPTNNEKLWVQLNELKERAEY